TDRGRDGKPVACATGGTVPAPDFRIVLVATNGVVSWGEFLPDQKGLHDCKPICGDYSRKVIWYSLPEALRPGRHFLGTIPVVATSGTPSITLGTSGPEGRENFTGFSSKCREGQAYDEHILDEGDGGFQSDGLPYGGTANTPPVLTAPNSLPARAGSKTSFRITAYDRDGDPVTFRLGSAIGRLETPSFVAV